MTNEQIIDEIRAFDSSLTDVQVLGLGLIVLSAYFKGKEEILTNR